jgi:hypothetical protein
MMPGQSESAAETCDETGLPVRAAGSPLGRPPVATCFGCPAANIQAEKRPRPVKLGSVVGGISVRLGVRPESHHEAIRVLGVQSASTPSPCLGKSAPEPC